MTTPLRAARARQPTRTQQRSEPRSDSLDAPIEQLVELLNHDYSQTASFIESVVGTEATIRGWLITLWLGLLGFGFDRKLWELAALAIVVTIAFALVDAYHATLYGYALRHARSIEAITALYFSALSLGADDPEGMDEVRVRLAAHRLGLFNNLWTFGLRDLRYARPTIWFRAVYPVLLAIAAVCLALIATR